MRDKVNFISLCCNTLKIDVTDAVLMSCGNANDHILLYYTQKIDCNDKGYKYF